MWRPETKARTGRLVRCWLVGWQSPVTSTFWFSEVVNVRGCFFVVVAFIVDAYIYISNYLCVSFGQKMGSFLSQV